MIPFEAWQGLLIPFVGTTLGAACVFFVRGALNISLRRALTGFAAGVMTAAAVWSLLIPSLEQSAKMGMWSFIPAVSGFWLGILFLWALDRIVPHLHGSGTEPEGMKSPLKRTTMMALAVALHNLPEGMAVGAALAGGLSEGSGLTLTGALALSAGIALQNFPEGAVISMPLHSEGMSKARSFVYGVLSGAVEPAGASLMLLLSGLLLLRIVF